jgi:hypothetical protein
VQVLYSTDEYKVRGSVLCVQLPRKAVAWDAGSRPALAGGGLGLGGAGGARARSGAGGRCGRSSGF